MFKKTLLILYVVFSCMYATVFAASNIVINNVETKDVKNYIIELMVLNGSDMIVEQASDNNLALLTIKTLNVGLFGEYTYSYEYRLGYTFVQMDKDVILSFSERCTALGLNGATSNNPIGTVNTELSYLQSIKGYFNGMYLFGFDYRAKEKNGGFPITVIKPLSAFEKAGIKVGDVVVAVNDVKLKKDFFIDGLFFDNTSQTTQKFLIKRGQVEKIYNLTSEYIPQYYRKAKLTGIRSDYMEDGITEKVAGVHIKYLQF